MTEIPVEIAADVLAGGAPAEARDDRLDEGAAALAGGGPRSIFVHQRFLVAAAGGLMSAGIAAILLGWFGASRSILVSEQVPYLISGGLLGVALAMIGGLTFFAHWLTVLLRDNRLQHQELLRVIREERARDRDELLEAIRSMQEEDIDGRARGGAAQRPVRRAPRGS